MTVEELNVIITAQNREFNSAISDVMQRVDEMDERTKRYGNDAGEVFTKLAATVSALGIGKIISDSITSGGELEQNLGGSIAVFERYADRMQKTASTAFKDMGLSEAQYLSTANKMGALFKGSGLDIAYSADMTQKAMQRAADVASVMGIDTKSAMESVTGAAKGNFTMMDNLGVAINDTTLQIYAQEHGLGKLETTQQKVTAAMQMFLERTEYAAGNYARENATFAGSLSTLKAELADIEADLGTTLLPSMTAILSIARSGLETVSPLVLEFGEGINNVAGYLAGLSPTARTMLMISLASAAAIPVAAKAQMLYNAANTKWSQLLGILIPKEMTRATVLKATVGWLGIIVGLLALVADVGATAREMNTSEGESLGATAKGADTAADSVDGLAESYDGLGKSADTAKGSLLAVDKLNIAGGTASGFDFDAISESAESAAASVGDFTADFGDLEDEIGDLSAQLGGLGDTFSTTFSDIGAGFKTMLDAFDFDSDTQLDSLYVLNEKVRQLFGDDWTKFWNDVGSTINQAFGGQSNLQSRTEALQDIEGWLWQVNDVVTGWMGPFQQAWTEFWMGYASPSMRTGIETIPDAQDAQATVADPDFMENYGNYQQALDDGFLGTYDDYINGNGRYGYPIPDDVGTDYRSSFTNGTSAIDPLSTYIPPPDLSGTPWEINANLRTEIMLDGAVIAESDVQEQLRALGRSNGY